MSKTVFLDTGPLGILTNPRRTGNTQALILWGNTMLQAGHRLIVPAIADFELRRELERRTNIAGLQLLDMFNAAEPDRYLPLTDTALKLAAKRWAQARNRGNLPADPKELNGDILIAAQALDYQAAQGLSTAEIVIATVNVGHLALFARAEVWSNIV